MVDDWGLDGVGVDVDSIFLIGGIGGLVFYYYRQQTVPIFIYMSICYMLVFYSLYI
jgi:hypothetical protein